MFDSAKYVQLTNQRAFENGPPEDVVFHQAPGEGSRREFKIQNSRALNRGSYVDVGVHLVSPDRSSKQNMLFHFHDFFELIYVHTGSLRNEIDYTEQVQLDKNHVLLLNPNARHRLLCDDPQAVIFNLMLSRSFVEHTLLSLFDEDNLIFYFFLNSIYGGDRIRSFLYLPLNPAVEQRIQCIIKEHCDRQPLCQQMIAANLLMLFGEFARLHKEELDVESELLAQSSDIGDILRYLRLNFATATLASTARKFNYSESYFSRMIKRQTGKRFTELLSEIRLETACNYLKNSDLPVEKISEIIGYQNPANFFRLFKKHLATSPKDFRRQYRE
ncbi:MAG: AraC family transcriptional regulator [Massilioclostridium sp.]|nr:AraC family transcriptional regulator [Massilioclostridium sp.]MEE1491800.1 AraC family transcriptional regulator [Massilioclostridium sp.]